MNEIETLDEAWWRSEQTLVELLTLREQMREEYMRRGQVPATRMPHLRLPPRWSGNNPLPRSE